MRRRIPFVKIRFNASLHRCNDYAHPQLSKSREVSIDVETGDFKEPKKF